MKRTSLSVSTSRGVDTFRVGAERFAAKRKMLSRRDLWVIGMLAPTLVAAIYYSLIAADRYVSEATYVVNRVDAQKLTGLDLLLQTFGKSHANESTTIQSYLLSRDSAEQLGRRLPLRDYFSSKNADVLSRFPYFWQNRSFESLFDYYLDHVSVLISGSKGVSTISVVAFQPKEAHAICEALLRLAEGKVNELNARAERDAVEMNERNLTRAREHLLSAQATLAEFRTRSLLLDPNTSSLSVMQTLTTLSTELSQTLVQIAEMQKGVESSPLLKPLQTKADSLKAAIAAQRARLGNEGDALAPKIAQFERMNLDLSLAKQEVEFASKSLDTARQEAQRKKIYIERVAGPSLPDSSQEPKRVRRILTVFVFSLAIASVLWILKAGVAEHAVDE